VVVGGFGGVLVWLLDHPMPEPPSSGVSAVGLYGVESAVESSSLIGRVLALLGVLLFVLPIVGLGVSLAAYCANRRTSGWTRSASRAALALSLISTVGLLALIALE
jgi:hypothetical protein